jgi:SNF2 family DNA or RNA helicase
MDLAGLLTSEDRIPDHVKTALRLMDHYANETHPAESSRCPDIGPCISALINVTTWYFSECLATNIPRDLANAVNSYELGPVAAETPQPLSNEAAAREMGLAEALRPYQWEGVSFLARSDAALLADEMGLGKTVQAIVALRLVLRQSLSKRALIVAPSSLAFNWSRELAKWAPELSVRRVSGDAEDRGVTYHLPVQVLIATYDQLRMDVLDLDSAVHFDVVVLDEAQRVKNRHSRSALACRLLNHSRSWALTGTPLENSLDDLVSLFTFLKPGLIDAGMAPGRVHTRIQSHFLRRRKRDVLRELPPIMIQDIPLELAGRQEIAYTEMWVSRREEVRSSGIPVSETALLAVITKLKQLCNYDPASGESVKWDALSLLLEDSSEPDDKIIVFSQYVQTLRFISERLQAFPHDVYTGEQTQQEREEALRRFKTLEGPRALLVSLRAGGVGLNIQEASTVVLFDRWWNPAVEDQAIQRAHRFGRSRPLHVIRYLVADTIEDRIQGVLHRKQLEFERYVDNAECAEVKAFTRDELRGMLGLSVVDADNQRTYKKPPEEGTTCPPKS